MSKVFVPTGYNTVMPYIIVKDAEKFMAFMKEVFGATEKMSVPAENGGIMHAEVMIGESCIMFSNSTNQFPVQNAGLYIHVANADQTYADALKVGATSIMPPDDKDYGRSGGILDPFGNTWWVTTTKE